MSVKGLAASAEPDLTGQVKDRNKKLDFMLAGFADFVVALLLEGRLPGRDPIDPGDVRDSAWPHRTAHGGQHQLGRGSIRSMRASVG